MEAALAALIVLVTAWPAAAQFELRRRPAPRPMAEGRPVRDVTPPDPHELWCRTQPPSCECGGFPIPTEQRASMRAFRRRLQSCVNRSTRRNPTLRGRVVFEVEIHRGRVRDVRIVEDSVSAPAMVRCMARATRVLRFPDVTGTTTIRYPIVFEPPSPASPAPATASGSGASR